MKTNHTITLIFIAILFVSCRDSKIEGYFRSETKSLWEDENYDLKSPIYNVSDHKYYRINGDTVVEYYVNDLVLDSLVSVWDGKGYYIFNYDENKRQTGIVSFYNGKKYIGLGESKYVIVDDNHLTHDNSKNIKKLQSIEDTISVEAILLKAIIKQDTLSRISKKYFKHFLNEELKQDSILFHHPFIDNYEIQKVTNDFIEERIQGEVFGKLLSKTLDIKRLKDDVFLVSFKTKHNDLIEDHLFTFDGNLKGEWSIERPR